MADFTIKQDDLLPILASQLTDPSGNPYDLTGTTVEFRYRLKGSTVVVTGSGTVAITNATEGRVEYAWEAVDTATAGLYYFEWRIIYPGPKHLTVPNSGPDIFEVVETLATQEEAELLMSISELKDWYLFGTDLTDDNGDPFPDTMFEHYIAAATAWLEKELDIPLLAIDIVEEGHDHYGVDYGRWGYFQLDKYPVISVDEVKFQYPSMTSGVVIQDEWIVVEDEGQSGVLQIVPGQGNISDVLLIPGSLMPMWSGATGRVPQVWRISYRAGFEPGTLPKDLSHAIGMHAAIGVFNIAGDLIAGAGIANISISVPGLNQNVGTTSSATNSGYGARILEYQKELKEMLPNLRRYYGKNTRLVVV